MPKMVNLGCGNRFHPDWINIDMRSKHPAVIEHDLSKGIPADSDSCDVVYHAAVLEHIRRDDAERFISECYRVLRPGGVIRVGVPDLEKICRIYLEKLDAASSGNPDAEHDYDWVMLELLDQMVREKGGGGMLKYLANSALANQEFVFSRIGDEGRQIVQKLANKTAANNLPNIHHTEQIIQRGMKVLRNIPIKAREWLLRALLGESGLNALSIGQFRLAGEVHQWMYDRYSLSRLLVECGFHAPTIHNAHTSSIPGWSGYHLDVLANGAIIKPDLFFMEAVK
jgi:predicted SAM-dependent methyltransferase